MIPAYKGLRDWLRRARDAVRKFGDDIMYEINTPAANRLPPNERWKVNVERFPKPIDDSGRYELKEKLNAEFIKRTAGFAADLASGKSNPAEFHARMSLEIRNLHTSQAVAGAGGWGAMDANQFAKLEARITKQINYLDNWVAQLMNQEVLSEAQIAYRASLYSGASTETFEAAKATSYGMPELPTHPADQTECRTNCKCRWEIVKLAGVGNWDCYWRRSPVESCINCLAREAAFNPLKIREGKILPFPEKDLYAA